MLEKDGEIALLKVLNQKLETDVKDMECLKDAAEEKMEKFKDGYSQFLDSVYFDIEFRICFLKIYHKC